MPTPANLMWVEYGGATGTQNDDYELQAAKRQHVMLHFLNNPPGEPLSLLPQASVGANKAVNQRIEGLNRRYIPKTQTRRLAPQPSTALIRDVDRTVSKAAYWHFYNPYTPKDSRPADWINQCRSDWNGALWEFSRGDEILREIFMSYAAAKEGHMRGADTRKGYLSHKGNAIRLLSRELGSNGGSINISAIATICLLSKAAFAEEEYDIAESHVQAISFLIGNRLDCVPGFLWLFIVWADLRMTKVLPRAPRLPYGVHSDFQVSLPAPMVESAKESARLNIRTLTLDDDTSTITVEQIFERLHQLALAYDDKECDWKAAWTVCYENAYMLALARQTDNDHPATDMDLICLAAHLQYAGTVSPFVPQEGLQRRMQTQLMRALCNRRSGDLCDRWQNHGSFDALLWVLFNTAISFIAYPLMLPSFAKSAMVLLRRYLNDVIGYISLDNGPTWEERLKAFPFTRTWNRRYFQAFCDWFETGLAPEMTDARAKSAPFGNLRLTFDAVSTAAGD